MPVIMAMIARARAFFKETIENAVIIYSEDGIEPFKKSLLTAVPILLVLYAFVYLPLGSKVKALKVALEKRQIVAVYYADYMDAKARLETYQRGLPDPKDKEEWLNVVLTSTTKIHGIVFDAISSQSEAEAGGFQLVSRGVSITTTYDKLGKWVADMEKSPQVIRVVEAEIKKDSAQLGTVKVDIKFSTIFPKYGVSAVEK
jgi:Tfp pilus assembly protein PilO